MKPLHFSGRLDAEWFERATFPHRMVMPTRFSDLDLLGHINNVAMAGIFEDGRVRMCETITEVRRAIRPKVRALVVSNTLNYLAEAYYPDHIALDSGVGQISRSSWQIVQRASQRERLVAIAICTMVVVGADGSVPMPEALDAELKRHIAFAQ